MVAANGDFKTDLSACATNALAGGKHCKPGDKVGKGTITATADYPDFRGKHFPVLSNAVTVDWTWGGYKDVTVHDGETDQFKLRRLPRARPRWLLLRPVRRGQPPRSPDQRG
ncbi:hypothetical protein [Tepidiforma sp.]|uniref:hypothetical protein n=1 Tax=Tepidiforma sp. TaxID=2682230 RepID=UPI00258864C1|nr:hypothetical protein [Tepidiforma sp.]